MTERERGSRQASHPAISRWLTVLACLLFLQAGLSRLARAQAILQDDRRVLDASEFGRRVSLTGRLVAAKNGDPSWARPDLDDRRWVVLDPKKPLSGQGFGDAKSIWYRVHVRLRPGSSHLAVYVNNLGDNYAVYANGERLGGQGGVETADFSVAHPPQAFIIPNRVLAAGGSSLVLALHVNGGRQGFYNQDPVDATTVMELIHPDDVRAQQSYDLTHHWVSYWILVGFDLLVGLSGFVIWWSLRDQQEYLALAVWLLSSAAASAMTFWIHLHSASVLSLVTLLVLSARAVSNIGELEFMRLLLRRERTWLWFAMEFACILAQLVVVLVNTGKLPIGVAAIAFYTPPFVTEALVSILLLRGARRGNRDAPFLLLPVLLWSFTELYQVAGVVTWSLLKYLLPSLPQLHFYTYSMSTGWFSDVLGLVSLMLIILQRTVRLSRDKAGLAAEVAAAEQLQVLLMARASRATPGFAVETVYRPMEQVGGDFFLVQPCEDDDSLVAIVGDVSGKGLQAAMRVSMILGVLQREVMSQPDRVLHTLNRALLAQGDFGFTTACCVRLENDGSFCFANAGHLNPYVDGEEITAEGALPLGITADAEYPVLEGCLSAGQTMVLLSDGVAEARSKKGELFGFERLRLASAGSAAQIAEEAQNFGQEDDITVLSLSLTAV